MRELKLGEFRVRELVNVLEAAEGGRNRGQGACGEVSFFLVSMERSTRNLRLATETDNQHRGPGGVKEEA